MCIPIVLFIGLKYVPPFVFLPLWLSSMLNSTFIEILFLLPENFEVRTNGSIAWHAMKCKCQESPMCLFLIVTL